MERQDNELNNIRFTWGAHTFHNKNILKKIMRNWRKQMKEMNVIVAYENKYIDNNNYD